MNNEAKWSLDEYFNNKGISIDGGTRSLLVAELEGLVAYIGSDFENEYHTKYVERTDEQIDKLDGGLIDAHNGFMELVNMTYEYDFTPGGYLQADAEMVTKKLIEAMRELSTIVVAARSAP